MKKDFVSADKQPQLQTFRVFVQQVNQQVVEVRALDADEARQKGYAKWRREYAHSHVSAVEPVGRDHGR